MQVIGLNFLLHTRTLSEAYLCLSKTNLTRCARSALR